jgi:hypothetical protein
MDLQQIADKYQPAFTLSLYTILWQIMVNKSCTGAFYALHDGQLVVAQPTGGYVYGMARFNDEVNAASRKIVLDDLNAQVFGLDHSQALAIVGESMAQ